MTRSPHQRFLDAAATAGNQPTRTYAALEELAKDLVGLTLFTIMTSDSVRKLSERVYSNRPDIYPVTGRKAHTETLWSETTLRNKMIFVANTIEEIAKVFDDHAMILSLGCELVMSMPIVLDGEVIGLVNCLHTRGHFTEARIEAASALKLPAAICMLLHAKAVTSEPAS